MEVMTLHHPFDNKKIADGPVVLAMGFFDGVHASLIEVIERAQAETQRRGVKLAVLTYQSDAVNRV